MMGLHIVILVVFIRTKKISPRFLMNNHCEKVKAGHVAEEDFAAFLRHVSTCQSCQRRIKARFIVEFNQREK